VEQPYRIHSQDAFAKAALRIRVLHFPLAFVALPWSLHPADYVWLATPAESCDS
jgi:hypothetical protein